MTSRRKKTGKASADRPFDAKILKRARQIASSCKIVLEPEPRAGFIGWPVEMPGVLADGKTPAACIEAVYRALEIAVATMLEAGQRPPVSSCGRRRKAQINLRVTPEEKMVLQEAAQQRGYQGISDFVRAAALRVCGAGQQSLP